MTDEMRLFGAPGAEELYLTIAEAFERQIEPHRDENNPEAWPAKIEEWTIADNRQFMPSPGRVLDEIGEIAADEAVTEWWWEALERHLDDEDVKAKVEEALDLLASKVKYWMADRHVATYEITLDADDRPLVDGRPLYVRVCPYWPSGRHVFRGHTDGSTDPCRCGAKWNGPKPAIPPDPRRPEDSAGRLVNIVDEEHEHENWCRIHNRRMAGVRATGNWACHAYYEQHEIKDGDCILELRLPDGKWAGDPQPVKPSPIDSERRS